MKNIVIQLICPDQKGIIAQLTSILYKSNNNILSIEQHVDKESKKFYIRVLIEYDSKKNVFPKSELLNLNKKLSGKLNLFDLNKKIRVAILGTKESEPIYDLLIKNQSNQLNCDIPIIISNHNNLSSIANQFEIDFFKINNNEELLKIIRKQKIELIVLARYMQIIPDNIVKLYKNNIINIHHGFLPAFKGAKPYHQAYKKGVKIIGATSHYVTSSLDEGPIITQDVVKINHNHSVSDIIQLGREIEKNVLYNAVKAHLEHRIIVFNNKTILFK
tara:strand:+ start:18 stop:839 length:822 start_codon:yes stop_codon:yes gene_type:complete